MVNESSKPDAAEEVAREIRAEASKLVAESETMRTRHQLFTVLTILLGVIAPAVVTYQPPSEIEVYWRPIAILITAFATASATIRTVLRYGDRFANSALTSIALGDLRSQLSAKRQEILTEVKEQYIDQKLYELAAWAQQQMYSTIKSYVEREVSAITKEPIELAKPPQIQSDQKLDSTKKSS